MEGSDVSKFIIQALAIVLYFIPTLIAKKSEHPRLQSIGVLNFLLGWTVLGWVGALIWALSKPLPVVTQPSRPLSLAEELAKLDKMWDRGEIDNAQYLRIKDDLLKKHV